MATFQQTRKMCKFGHNCRRAGCYFAHPGDRDQSIPKFKPPKFDSIKALQTFENLVLNGHVFNRISIRIVADLKVQFNDGKWEEVDHDNPQIYLFYKENSKLPMFHHFPYTEEIRRM